MRLAPAAGSRRRSLAAFASGSSLWLSASKLGRFRVWLQRLALGVEAWPLSRLALASGAWRRSLAFLRFDFLFFPNVTLHIVLESIEMKRFVTLRAKLEV